jgi:hypothetical protein
LKSKHGINLNIDIQYDINAGNYKKLSPQKSYLALVGNEHVMKESPHDRTRFQKMHVNTVLDTKKKHPRNEKCVPMHSTQEKKTYPKRLKGPSTSNKELIDTIDQRNYWGQKR